MQFIIEYWAQWAFALMGGAVLAAIPKIKALWQAVLALLHDRIYTECYHFLSLGHITPMNAHITTNRTVSAATIARTAVLALALINQILSAAGKPLLPIDSTQLEQLISTGFTTVSALVNWWFNNSFTQAALAGDEEYERRKKSV